jgi:hypothetical protein
MSMTIEHILKGTGLGPMQSVGQMQVIPLLGDERADDPTFAPPELEVSTQGYGNVLLRNVSDRPTLVPPGAGWVVQHKAQDHALGGGAFVRPGQQKLVSTAMCIQQSQGGYIPSAKHAMSILPMALRPYALSVRNVVGFNKLWEALGALNTSVGLASAGGSLAKFLESFGKQLDEFVAELELLPRQIGAIVLIGGEVVGVERAPSAAFFASLWKPLIRLCYGSFAMAFGRTHTSPPVTRLPLRVTTPTLAGLRDALAEVEAAEATLAIDLVETLATERLERAEAADDVEGAHVLSTVANDLWAGQVVTANDAVVFGSITARKAPLPN